MLFPHCGLRLLPGRGAERVARARAGQRERHVPTRGGVHTYVMVPVGEIEGDHPVSTSHHSLELF